MKISSYLLVLLIFFPFITTIQSFELLHASNTLSINKSFFQARNVVFTLNENIILVSPVNNSVLPSGTIIRFNISDFNLVELYYHWDNELNNTWLPPYETTLPMGDGLHILHAYALDTLDSWEYQEYHFITDDTFPMIILTSTTNNSNLAPDSVINFDVIDDHLDKILYHWNKGNNQTLNIPYQITLPPEEGTHELTVYASDIVGHWVKERFFFTARPDLSPDSDNDGLSDYFEILLGTDPSLSTNRINDAPIDITDLDKDAPNSLQTALIKHKHIPATTWVIGTVDEIALEDQSDFYIFTTKYRTTGKIFLQTNLPTVTLAIFDLENRVNLSRQVQNTDLSISQTIRFHLSTISDYTPNALPYVVEIPIPLAIELLVVQIDGGMAGKVLYSIWMVEDPPTPYLPAVIILFNILLFLGLPFIFFMILRWENRRVIKKQKKIKSEEMSFLPLKTEEVIINVHFYEWIFSSLILLIM
ncbi:thrombospondin type 3 repeat-containing protein, partial [Candidatus Hodarchaeum mangrovi]